MRARLGAGICLVVSLVGPARVAAGAEIPWITATNLAVRIMAANLTGSSQMYDPPALRILHGLKPDIVAIQEFNYGGNTPAEFRAMIDSSLGTNYQYYRENGSGYTIPNGVISRFPIVASGTFDDVTIPDRGFAWALVDLPGVPGTNNLYVVSVHLKASSGATNEFKRATQATNLTALIQAYLTNAPYLVVAGDMNIDKSSEAALAKFKTYLSDDLVPRDTDGKTNTNNGRTERYDYVLANFALASNQVATVQPTHSFAGGLVFDSRTYTPLSDVPTVTASDSSGAQHMAVVKDYQVAGTVTNLLEVPVPALEVLSQTVLRWQGASQLTYTVQATTQLPFWTNVGTAASASGIFYFTNSALPADKGFFRVRFP